MAVGDSILDFGRSSASMKSKWIQIMRTLFQERTDGAEPSDLNAGIIGLAFDFMSNAIEDQWYNVNTRSKEIFPTVAKFDDSVYLHATTAHITDFFAKPAVIDVVLAIRTKDIISKSIERPGLGYKMLTISSNTQLVLDKYYYKIDYPIDIVVKQGSNGKSLISCKYDMTVRNSYSDIESTYVIGKTQIIDNVEYYILKTTARQLALTSQEIIYTPNSVESDIFTFPYTSQLAGFEVYYRETNDVPWEKIDLYYQGVLLDPAGKKFCYYRLLNDTTYDISFSVNPKHFQPAFNSRIRVDTYITEGAAGNFTFTDPEIQVIFNQNTDNIFENAFIGIQPIAQLLLERSRNGTDRPSLDLLRNMVVEYRSSRNTITSEPDLQRYLNSNGVKSVRQRDDILMREFMAYTVLEDIATSFIIPTRTGDLSIIEEDTTDMPEIDARMISPDNVYQFWLANDATAYNHTRFVIAHDSESPDNNSPTTALKNSDWVYLWDKLQQYDGMLTMCPYLIKIFKNPYFVALYDIQSDATLGAVFGYNNPNSPEKFAINKVTIVRESVRSDTYVIAIEIAISDIIMEEFLSATTLADFRMKVKMELLDDVGRTYAFIEMNKATTNADGTKLIFSAELITDNCLHPDDMIRIVNQMIYPTADEVYAGTDIVPQQYFIPFKSQLRIYIVYRPDVPFASEFNNYMLTANDIARGFVVTDMYEIAEQFQFVRDVSNVFSTALEVIASQPVWPTYNQNIQATYDRPIYQYNADGTIELDGNNDPIVIHNIGELMYDADGSPIWAHRIGEPIMQYDPITNKPIYAVPSKITFMIKRLPFITLPSLLNDDYKRLIYTKLKSLTDTLQKQILPRLVENNSVTIGLYNTTGPSEQYIQGYGDAVNYSNLPRLNFSIILNCRLADEDMAESMRSTIIQETTTYVKNAMASGSFNVDGLLTHLRTTFTDIEYIEFVSLNGASSNVQTIKLSDKATSQIKMVPEQVSIDQKMDEALFKESGTVVLTPNIVVNILTS